MQNVGGIGFEPANVARCASPRDHRETRWQVGTKARNVRALLEELGVPEQRAVVEDRVLLGERHVVGEARAWKRNVDPVRELVAGIDHAVVHERSGLGVVEHEHLAGVRIGLLVRGDSPVARERTVPRLAPELLERARIERVQVAALVEARLGHTGVDDDVGARRVFQTGAGSPAVLTQRLARAFGQAGPQRLASFVLGRESDRGHEAVSVLRLAVGERDRVQHPVAVEWVIPPDRFMDGVLGVAQVDTFEVGGNRADHVEVEGIPLAGLRPPCTGAVRVDVVRRKSAANLVDHVRFHFAPSPRSYRRASRCTRGF